MDRKWRVEGFGHQGLSSICRWVSYLKTKNFGYEYKINFAIQVMTNEASNFIETNPNQFSEIISQFTNSVHY